MSEEEKKIENTSPEDAQKEIEQEQSAEIAATQASEDAPTTDNVEKVTELETIAETAATGEASVEAAKPADEKVEIKEEKATEEKKIVADGTPRAPSKKSDQAKNKDQSEDDNASDKKGSRGKRDGKKGKGSHKKRTRHEEQATEFIEKVVQVRRVTKVVKGGKKLSFRTTVIIGNEKGKVGVGVGKASEVLIAIKKAIADARKSLVDVSTVAGTNTISHTVRGIAGGSNVLLKPAAEGTGIIAGGTARIVLELAGVGDILAKSQGSKSPLNVARATVNALGQLRSFQEVADLRGISKKKMLFA